MEERVFYMRVGLGNLYIITTCIGMFRFYGLEQTRTPWWLYCVLCVLWIAIGAACYSKDEKKPEKKFLFQCISNIRDFFGIPYLLFWGFSIIGWVVAFLNGSFESGVFIRALSTTIQYLFILLSVMATAYIFKGKLLRYTFIAIVANNCIVILWAVMRYGIGQFFQTALVPFKEIYVANTIVKMLEIHDVTFAFGFFFIYYSYAQSKSRKQKIYKLIICAFFIYIGYKRIQFAALFLVLLAAYFVKGRTKRNIQFWVNIFTAAVLIISYLYIWLVDSGVLVTLADRFGINFMGRLRVYGQMANYFDFSPRYLGLGMMSGRKIGEALIGRGLLNFTGHSEVLMNYFDFGFWGFLCWIGFTCYFVTKKSNKVYGSNVARIWILLTAYAFITYLTDNTMHYYAFQASYMIVMFHAMYTSNGGSLQGTLHARRIGDDLRPAK